MKCEQSGSLRWIAECPQLLSYVINVIMRNEDPVLPSGVLKIATMFPSVIYPDMDPDHLGAFVASVHKHSLVMKGGGAPDSIFNY